MRLYRQCSYKNLVQHCFRVIEIFNLSVTFSVTYRVNEKKNLQYLNLAA